MRLGISTFLGTILALSIAACSSNPVPTPPGPNDSIAFGYIEMEEAPTNLQWLTIRQVRPPTEKPFWSAGVNDGIFFNWYLDPGSYAVTQFGGNSGRTRYTFNVPRNLTKMRLVIKKPGIYFLGSYKYVRVRTKGLFTPDNFDLKKMDSPSEKELVQKLLKVVEGTAVEAKLQARLRGLK